MRRDGGPGPQQPALLDQCGDLGGKGREGGQPAFSIAFRNAAYGFAALTADNRQLAFMQGIQNKDIQIQGNPMLVMWFQGLMKHLMPKKKKPEQKAA